MMQDSPHTSISTAQTWPAQSIKSIVSGSQNGSSPLINHIDKKLLTRTKVVNGIHGKNPLVTTSSTDPKRHKGIVVSPPGTLLNKDGILKDAIIGTVSKVPVSISPTKIQWTTKTIIGKDVSGGISNLTNSWLNAQKKDDEKYHNSSPSIPNGNAYHGFDLTKLYPELSAKLGLTKPSEGTQKSSTNKVSHIKEPLTYTCAVNKTNSGAKSVNVNFKKLLANKSHFKDSSRFNYVRHNSEKGHSGASHITNSNAISASQSISEKPKDFKHTPANKISEDKLRRFLVGQPNFKRLSLANKKESKSVSRKCKSQSVSLDYKCDKNLSGGCSTYPSPGNFQKPNIISILPRNASLPKSETLSPSQLRVHKLYQENYAYKSDLFPLGFDPHECDNVNEDDISNIKSFSTFSECLLSESQANPPDPSQLQTLNHSHSAHRRQVIMAKERLKKQEQSLSERWSFTRALLEAARENPYKTASTLSTFINNSPDLSSAKRKLRKCQSSLLVKRLCAYEFEDGKECGQKALPGTRHCVRHITYNVDQQLFSQCLARMDDNSLCRIPTFDVLHESPYCQAHGGANLEPPPTEVALPRTKRPRKKSKMPVLSRYGKRSKKRRKSLGISSIIPSTSVRPPINSPGVCLGSPQGTSPITPRTSPSFSTSCSGKADESDFDDEFEGMIGGLPLEAASRFLEDPGDLQDVLNKIPEEEISQIFYDTESKPDGCTMEEKTLVDKSAHDVGSPLLVDHSVVTSSCVDHSAVTSSCVDHSVVTSNCTQMNNTEHSLNLPLDVATLTEMAANGSIDSIISSSFNQQELNAISQVLSNMVQDESLNLDGFQLVDNTNSQNFEDSIMRVESDLKTENFAVEDSVENVDNISDERRKVGNESSSTVSDCKMSVFKTNKIKVDTTPTPLQTLQ